MQDSLPDVPNANDISVKDFLQVHPVNILVLGDDFPYKARFISTFLQNSMYSDPSSEFAFKKLLTIDDTNIVVNIHTDSGMEEMFGFFDMCMRHGEGAVFVYSVYKRESFLMFESIRERLDREVHIPIAIVATPDGADEVGNLREVTSAEGKKLAESCGGMFYEYSTSESEQETVVNECMMELLTKITRQKSGYNADKNNDGSKPESLKYNEFEVVVCGDAFVGKTQLIRQLVQLPFQGQYIATTDRSVHKHKAIVQDVGFILKIVDIGGLDMEANLTKNSLQTAQGIVLVYSITSRESFLGLEAIRKRILTNRPEARIPMIIVGNKLDLALSRQVTTEEGKALAKKWSCGYFETCASSTNSDTIAECFELLITDIEHAHSHPALDSMTELDRQGYLTKEGNKFKARNKRYFVLKDNAISFSNEAGQPTKGSLLLTENASVEVIAHDGKSSFYDFVVTSGDEKITLGASSEAEREAWVSSIKANLATSDVAMGVLDEVMRMMLWETCAKMSEVFRRRLMGEGGGSPARPDTPLSPNGKDDLDERTRSAMRMASFSSLTDVSVSASPPKLNKTKSGFFRNLPKK